MIKAGDVVYLKSGGPAMAIETIEKEFFSGNRIATCVLYKETENWSHSNPEVIRKSGYFDTQYVNINALTTELE